MKISIVLVALLVTGCACSFGPDLKGRKIQLSCTEKPTPRSRPAPSTGDSQVTQLAYDPVLAGSDTLAHQSIKRVQR